VSVVTGCAGVPLTPVHDSPPIAPFTARCESGGAPGRVASYRAIDGQLRKIDDFRQSGTLGGAKGLHSHREARGVHQVASIEPMLKAQLTSDHDPEPQQAGRHYDCDNAQGPSACPRDHSFRLATSPCALRPSKGFVQFGLPQTQPASIRRAVPTFARTQDTMSLIVAPGVKTCATPISAKACRSASG
jgi:hypothetical protein